MDKKQGWEKGKKRGPMSEAQKQKIRESLQGERNPMWGNFSEARKKKDIDDRVAKLNAKLTQVTIRLNQDTEAIKVIKSHMTNLLRKADDYGILHEEIYLKIDRGKLSSFRLSSLHLAANLKEIFNPDTPEEGKEAVRKLHKWLGGE